MNLSTVPFIEPKAVNTRLPQSAPISAPGRMFDDYPKQTSLTAPVMENQHERLFKQTQKWVAATFFGTILKQMRESPFKTELSSGGKGGETFATMLDQRLADKMARGAGSKLVKAIVRKLEANKAYNKQKDASTKFKMDSSAQGAARIPANLKSAAEIMRTAGRLDVTTAR